MTLATLLVRIKNEILNVGFNQNGIPLAVLKFQTSLCSAQRGTTFPCCSIELLAVMF
jgi:hypothetical protein